MTTWLSIGLLVTLAILATLAIAKPELRRLLLLPIGVVAGALGANELARRFGRREELPDPDDDITPREPRRFDDEDARRTDRAADDTDLAARTTDRSIDDLAARARDRDARLDDLGRRAADDD